MTEVVQFTPGNGSSLRLAQYRAAAAGKDLKIMGKGPAMIVAEEVMAAHAEGRQPNTREALIRAADAHAAKEATAAAPAPSSSVTVAPKPAPTPQVLTAEQKESARIKTRHDAVMDSPHAKGRQTVAAAMLGGAPNASAADIIAALPTMPTDAQALADARRAKVDAMWDRAWNGEKAASPTVIKSSALSPEAARKASIDATWDRAWAKSTVMATAEQTATPAKATPQQSASNDVWARV